MPPQLLKIAPVFAVADPRTTALYYEIVFGFVVEGKSAFDYAVVSRDGCEIHFITRPLDAPTTKGNKGGTYITVEDPDALYEEFMSRGAGILYPPIDQPYGQRDFGVHDPEGYSLLFGKKLGA